MWFEIQTELIYTLAKLPDTVWLIVGKVCGIARRFLSEYAWVCCSCSDEWPLDLIDKGDPSVAALFTLKEYYIKTDEISSLSI